MEKSENIGVDAVKNWKLIKCAVAAARWTTKIDITNTNDFAIHPEIVFGDYRTRLVIPAGENIIYNLKDLTNWNFFVRPEKGKESDNSMQGSGQYEGDLYIEDINGLLVIACVEHIHCWIGGRVPTAGQGRQDAPTMYGLKEFPYNGPAPCGKCRGRVGGSKDYPFYGPANTM